MSTPPAPAAAAASFIGQVLIGRYRLDAVLGTGGMGAVYQARDIQTDAVLAIKLLHQIGPDSEDHQQRFFDEALIIGELFHPNIVQVIGFDKDKDGRPFMMMELLRGKDLYKVLEEREKLPLQKTLEIVRQVGSALHAAHSIGIAHRDIKPSNIFLARQKNSDGEEAEVVKVVDFGLSKVIDSNQMQRTARGIILGTLEYAAPEATLGDSSQVDFRADQWALAVMTYRMLSGKLPFTAPDTFKLIGVIREGQPVPLRSCAPDVPDHVVAAIDRAMTKDKEKRFESIQDFVRALDGLPLLSQSLSAADLLRVGKGGRRSSRSIIPIAAPPSPAKIPRRWQRVLAGLFVAIAVLAILTFALWRIRIERARLTRPAPPLPPESTPTVVHPPPSTAAPTQAAPLPIPAHAVDGTASAPPR